MGGLIAGIAVSTLVSAISGYMGSKAQKEAYEKVANATAAERAEFKKAYDESFGPDSYNAQMQKLGSQAMQTYSDMVNDSAAWDKYVSGDKAYVAPEAFSFTQEDFTDDPSYKVRLQEGLDALSQNLVSAGYAGSGYAAKEMNNYAQDQASKEYSAAYGRAYDAYKDQRNFNFDTWKNEASQYYQNLTNRLSGLDSLSKSGAQASTAQANALNSLATNNANSIAQQTSAQAAADMAGTSQATSMLDALAKGVNMGVGLYASQAGSTAEPKARVNLGTTDEGLTASIIGNTQQDYSDMISRMYAGWSDSLTNPTNVNIVGS